MKTNTTDKAKQAILNGKDDVSHFMKERKDIAKRTICAIFFSVILSMVRMLLSFVTIVQYVILLITTSYNSNLRDFSNKLISYEYKMMRYITLNENECPYPFADFPKVIERPDETVQFK